MVAEGGSSQKIKGVEGAVRVADAAAPWHARPVTNPCCVWPAHTAPAVEIARAVARRDERRVILVGSDGVESLAESICRDGAEAVGLAVDPANPEQFASALAPVVDRWGCPESLVIAPGVDDQRGFHELPWSLWQASSDTLLGAVGLLRTVLPLLLATADDGVVLFVRGALTAHEEFAGAAGALVDGALAGLSRCLVEESAIHRIRWYAIGVGSGIEPLGSSSKPVDPPPEIDGTLACQAAWLLTAPR